MSYADFTMQKIREELNFEIVNANLMLNVGKKISLTPSFKKILNEGIQLANAIDNEKSRSEFIVAPLLLRLKSALNNEISVFSGTELNIDKEKGLNGICDFLIAKSDKQYILTHPIIALVEAKNSNIYSGLGQCMAEMVAARLYNQKYNIDSKIIYGIVTTGSEWKFLTLEENTITIDNNEYFISDIHKLFSILVSIIKNA
jgi:hypothetical protein